METINYFKMKTCLTFFFFTCFAIFVKAQKSDNLSIQGKIVDEKNTPVALANILLINQADSKPVTTAVSDDKGDFIIKVKPGHYSLKITFLSFKEKIIPVLNVIDRDTVLGTIVLKDNAQILDEVVVTSEKSVMKLELDKRVYTIGKDLNNAGANASDILNNLPSVTVEADGTVNLRGSQDVRILIDGKPSSLAGTRSTDALRQLPGNLIESIEIITNPSSRNEAAGEAGIINIILKKNKTMGLNGTFTVNAGYPSAYGRSFNINYRKNKVNFFSSYGIDYRSSPGRGNSIQSYNGADTFFSYNQNSNMKRNDLSHNLIAGLDYFINESSTLTGSLLFSPSNEINKTKTEYFDYDKTGQLIKNVTRNETEYADEQSLEYSLGYKKKFKEKDHTLAADFKYVSGQDNEITDYNQYDPLLSSTTVQHASNLANERNWLLQADYVKPFGDNAKIETGLRSNIRIVENEYALEEIDSSGNWIVLPAFNNNMIYTEKIHAAYFMGSRKFKKIGVQAGLRAEASDITTELTVTEEINPRKYFNIFPSANISYELNGKNTLQLSYSYRINRPRFRDLLPFSNFSDLRYLFIGNPDLNPEYTHSAEAGHLLNWEHGSFLSNVYYRHRAGVIQRLTSVNSVTGVTEVIPVNLATQNNFGLELNLSFKVKKWWQFNSNLNLFRAITDGAYKGEDLHSDTYTLTGRTSSQMSFLKKWNFQTTVNYWAPRITPQGKDLAVYFIDIGITTDVLKGNGTITFSGRDILNTRMRRNIVDQGDYYSKSEFQWRSRQFLFSLTYRLNRIKENGNKNDQNRQEDEM
jgi:outer membrane receptor protein involved in Fe transport